MMDFPSLKKTLVEGIDALDSYAKARQQKIIELREKLKRSVPIKGKHCESVEKELVHKIEIKNPVEVLRGKVVCGVDGSQMMPNKFINLPLAVVQAAYFINRHDGTYKKEVFSELYILKEDELFKESKIDIERFKKEVDTFLKIMEPDQFLFFDGSLILSFIQQFSEDIKREYIDSVNRLIKAAKEKKCYLIGYVDTSYAKEIVDELNGEGVEDAALFDLRFGERSGLFVSHRDVTKNYYEEVGFFYGRVNDKRAVRVEIPKYCFEKVDEIWGVVLGECMVNRGYPYVLERSHEAAVITEKDKRRFFKLLEVVSSKKEMRLMFSKKTLTKREN